MAAQQAGIAAKPVIVFTDVKTLRLAVDVSVLDPFGEVRVFDALEDEELNAHLRDADIVVTNRNLFHAALAMMVLRHLSLFVDKAW